MNLCFNLFDWVLYYCLLVWFLLILLMLVGIYSYFCFGCEEDLNFIIKIMIISVFLFGVNIGDMLD